MGVHTTEFRQLDDLILNLKGLVLVHKLRERRGAAAAELGMYLSEIDRVREQIASLVRTGDREARAASAQPSQG
jgi:hypothetical protein